MTEITTKMAISNKIVTMIMMAVFISSCDFLNKPITLITKPKPFGITRGLKDGAPEGTPAFRGGWKDGCDSGIAAYGTIHYKATYGYTYNPAHIYNDEYHNAWLAGFRHCRWYTAQWTR